MLKILFSPSWYDARIVLADRKIVERNLNSKIKDQPFDSLKPPE
jgi:hypothetical protein